VAGEVLKVGGSHAQRARTNEEACDRASDVEMLYFILPHCNTILPQCDTAELDSLLATATRKGRWNVAAEVLKVGGSETQRARTITDVCDRASDLGIRHFVLPHCNTEELDHLLATATRKGRWNLAGKVLKVGVSETERARTIEEACDRAEDWDIGRYILPHCNTAELDRVLVTATRKGQWNLAREVLKIGGTEEQRAKTIKEVCDRADDWNIEYFVLPKCNTAERDILLATATRKGLWDVAGKVLKEDVSETQRARTIEEACDKAGDLKLTQYILSLCTHEYFQSKLLQFVTRGLWRCVGLVLDIGVNDKQHKWAAEEASKKANEQDFINHIWPLCTSIESVLPHLVRRRLWRSVSFTNVGL
jgi:hypothetical protein